MRYSAPSPFLVVTVMATQLLGPAVLWAAEQRGIRIDANRQIVVSALNGDQLTSGTKPLQFREVLAEGATLTTGPATTAELLIGNRAVVTFGHGTTAQVHTVSADQTTIQVANGLVRVAAASSAIGSQGLVTVQTPMSQVQTRGGILRVTVDAPMSKAEYRPTGAQAYRASYAPGPLMAAATPSSDIIHVEEGTAEIPGVGPSGGLLTMKAGQRVMVQAGRVGTLAEAVSPGAVTTGVLATTGHTQTPKEGREYLVALQVDQATKLGKALTGEAETGNDDSEKKDSKNVINGATGGVTLQNNLVSALFGTGNAANPAGSNPTNTTGAGYGTNRNNGFNGNASPTTARIADRNALLVFTKMDRVEPFVKKDVIDSFSGETKYRANEACGRDCLNDELVVLPNETNNITFTNVIFKQADRSDKSQLTVAKELLLVGGTQNTGHDGLAPEEALIIRGWGGTNISLRPDDGNLGSPGEPVFLPAVTVKTNSTFVINNGPERGDIGREPPIERPEVVAGGTLGRFSRLPLVTVDYGKGKVLDGQGIAIAGKDDAGAGRPTLSNGGESVVDAAITAMGANVTLRGGVTLDQGSMATIGSTKATETYFVELPTTFGRKFSGSLLSVINRPTGPTKLTMQDRMLGVYDGSIIKTDGGNKALLSVLDAKLTGSSGGIPLIDIAAGNHVDRKYIFDREGNIVATRDSKGNEILSVNDTITPGSPPDVTVTSALVTRSRISLDGALLEASAPLFALTKANMTTTNHFADLAGNQAQSLKLGDTLVALNDSKLLINSGHLLNLNNATVAITGYLFSLTNGSTLSISNGSLFSLNNGSSLTLNANAFGVFGSGTNTLSIDNNLCGAGAACGALVNSANQPLSLNGVPLRVAGVTENVVLPANFNVFAGNAAGARVTIGADDALFHVDPTSTLTITAPQ